MTSNSFLGNLTDCEKKMDEKFRQISGTIEKIVFHNPETLFAVISLIPDGEIMPIIVVGEIPNPKVGQHLTVLGKWVEHKQYGRQFVIEKFEVSAPKSDDAMIRYLSSDLIKGIGPIYAARITKKFGSKCIDIILNNPERLTEVEGIGKKRAKMIAEAVRRAFSEQAALQRLAALLFDYGFGIGTVKKIWRKYGDKAFEIVKNNPYLLAEEVWGIGFATADSIARAQGIAADDPRRVEAGILYALQNSADDGHCFLPKYELVKSAAAILEVDEEKVESMLTNLVIKEKVIADDDRIYLPWLHVAETSSADIIASLMSGEGRVHITMAESLVNEAQRELGIDYTDEQRRACVDAFLKKVLVITGGPGTGKTTILKAIIFMAKRLGISVKFAAPTGRAAKRLEEATGESAQTIHRLLKYNPGLEKFEYNRSNPLPVDMLILDEVSMVDVVLFWRVLQAMPMGGNLVLVGDADQLPSVGPGMVLRDLIASKVVPVVRLTKIMRQSEEGLIVLNAHRVLKGFMPIVRNKPDDDFFMEVKTEPEDAQRSVVDFVTKRIPKRFGFDPVREIQVITPMHKGRCGARELNEILRDRLNPNARSSNLPFAVGDKVMQITNNYELGVFNGELGIVKATNGEDEIIVSFDFGDVVYDSSYFNQLQLAYAITVHKSQGSEYEAVVLPLLTEHYVMLARNLLYTAITRARKLLVVVGTYKALAIAVRNDRPVKRYTALAERIAKVLAGREH